LSPTSFIGQMDEEVKNANFWKRWNFSFFRVGVNDANYLQHEFQPVFSEGDLINVDVYNAYVKTIVHNEPVNPFSMDLTRDMTKEQQSENPRVAEIDKRIIKVEIRERNKSS